MLMEFNRAVGRYPRSDIGPEGLPDRGGILIADKPEGDLGGSLGCDHRLEAFAGVAAPNSVHLAGRPRPGQFEDRAPFFSRRYGQANLAKKFLGALTKCFPACLDVGRRLVDAVIEAFERDAAGLVAKSGEYFGQDMDGIGGSAPAEAGMQEIGRAHV